MAVAYGTRINDDTNFITEIDLDNNTCETTGYIGGEAVDFSGGGSSDFSTATVTITNNNDVGLNLPSVFDAGELSPEAPALLYSASMGYHGAVTIVLYKGSAFIDLPSDDVVIDGNITAMGSGNYIITGDCSITIS